MSEEYEAALRDHGIPFFRVCDQCYDSFETWEEDEHLCHRCQREYLRETCPEAFAEVYDDEEDAR